MQSASCTGELGSIGRTRAEHLAPSGVYEEKLVPFVGWCEAQEPPLNCANLYEDNIV